MNGAAENGAAAGMIDAHQLLHDLGGDGNLATGDRPEPRLPQRAQRLLRGIGLIEVLGRDRFRQVLVAGAGALRIRVGQQPLRPRQALRLQ